MRLRFVISRIGHIGDRRIGRGGWSTTPGSPQDACKPRPQDAPTAEAAPMRWYKGNTHTHTINNGGDSTPDEVVTLVSHARLSVPRAHRPQLPHEHRRSQRDRTAPTSNFWSSAARK